METSVRWSSFGRCTASADDSSQHKPVRTRRFGALWPAFAGFMAISAPFPAFGDPTPPPGMAPYDHPVYHHGVRVLWHGVWRGKGGRKDDAAPAASAKTRPAVAAKPSPPNPNEYSILVDADDPCAARLAGEFVAALQVSGAKGRVIAGQTSPAALARAVKSDAADLAITAIDALVSDDKASVDWRERAPYIARLGAETVEIIAPQAIADVRQLAGRDVGFGAADSAGAATAATLFAHLGVAPKPSFAPLGPALADLAAGKLVAVVAVGARSSKTLADFGKDGRFHEIAIPWSPSLGSLYAPARVTTKDRPNLIAAGAKIDTLGAPMALVAIDAPPSSGRAERSATLTKFFFDGFDKLLGPDNDPSWREVNFAAVAPWPRLPAAQAWIKLNTAASSSSLDAFRAVAKTAAAANGGPAAQDSDRLFDSLMQWRGTGQ
jgi:hypothetical protein